MSRTCESCGRTWRSGATFCGACGDLLPDALAATVVRQSDGSGSRRRPVLAVALAVAVVAGAAAVPTLSIERTPPVTGEIGVPEVGDLQAAAPASVPAPRRDVPSPTITCRRDGEPLDCVAWSRNLMPPMGPDGNTAWVTPAGRRLLLPGPDGLEAVDAATGTRLWRRDDLPEVFPMDVSGDLAVVQTHDGGEGIGLLDLATGDLRGQWRGPTMLWGNLLFDDLVLTPPDAGAEPGIVARGLHDGVARWRWSTAWPWTQVMAAGGDRLVLVADGGEGGMAVLDRRNGNEIARTDASAGWVLGIVDQTLVVVEPHDGANGPNPAGDGGAVLRGLSTTDATVQWEREVPASQVPFGLADGVVVAPSTGLLTVLDATTGDVAWDVPLDSTSDLANHGGFFGWPDDDTPDLPTAVLTIDRTAHELVARNSRSSEVTWRRELPDGFAQATAFGDAVWLDGPSGFALLDAATGRATVEVTAPGVPVVSLDPLVLFHPPSGTVARLDPSAEAAR